MKSIGFNIVIGINKGYFHSNEAQKNIEKISELCNKLAENIFKVYNLYISTVISNSKTVYRKEWGCPKGGEDTFSISGDNNPQFNKDLDLYKSCVFIFARKLKEELKQSTVSIVFRDIDFLYLDD